MTQCPCGFKACEFPLDAQQLKRVRCVRAHDGMRQLLNNAHMGLHEKWTSAGPAAFSPARWSLSAAILTISGWNNPVSTRSGAACVEQVSAMPGCKPFELCRTHSRVAQLQAPSLTKLHYSKVKKCMSQGDLATFIQGPSWKVDDRSANSSAKPEFSERARKTYALSASILAAQAFQALSLSSCLVKVFAAKALILRGRLRMGVGRVP